MSSDDVFSFPVIEPTRLLEAVDARRDEVSSSSCGAPPPPSLAARLAARLASRSVGSIFEVEVFVNESEFNLKQEKKRSLFYYPRNSCLFSSFPFKILLAGFSHSK